MASGRLVRALGMVLAVGAAAACGVIAWRLGGLAAIFAFRQPKWDVLCIALAVCSALVIIMVICATPNLLCAARFATAYDRSTLLSRFTFWWVRPTLLRAAATSALELDDLPSLSASDDPARLYRRLEAALRRRRARIASAWTLLVSAYVRSQPEVFWQTFVLGWIFLACMFADPLLLHALLANSSIAAAAGPRISASSWLDVCWRLALVATLALSLLIRVAMMEASYFCSVRCGNNARSQLVIGLFRSCVGGSGSARSNAARKHSAARLTNLMATDCDTLFTQDAVAWNFARWVWSVSTLPMTLYFMWALLGQAAFAGAVGFALSNVLELGMARLTMPLVRRLQERRDARGALMGEMLRGVGPVLKSYACEGTWARRVAESREMELLELRRLRYLDAAASLLGGLLSQAAPIAIFGWYVLVQGRALDATTAFTALAWILQMQWSIMALPEALTMYAKIMPVLRRIADVVDVGHDGGDGDHRMRGGHHSGAAFAALHGWTTASVEEMVPAAPASSTTMPTPSISGSGGGAFLDAATTLLSSGGNNNNTPLIRADYSAAASRDAHSPYNGSAIINGSLNGGGDYGSSLPSTPTRPSGRTTYAGRSAATSSLFEGAGASPALSTPGGSSLAGGMSQHMEDGLSPLLATSAPPPDGAVACLRRARLSAAPVDEGGDGGNGGNGDETGVGVGSLGRVTTAASTPKWQPFGEMELTVMRGELLILCGAIGSGKSTLVASLAKARPLAAGELTITHRRAYCAQRPFLLRASVRANILFGLALEPARYTEAVRLSALEEDLSALAKGDLTDVGESGAALSEGQRARVALARAIYADAEAVFLDDTLASVDARTSAMLWGTIKLLLRREKAVVLATHLVSLVSEPEVSRVALIREGVITACAPPSELKHQLRGYQAALAAMRQVGRHTSRPHLTMSGADGAGGGGHGVPRRATPLGIGGGRSGSAMNLSVSACERLLRSKLRILEGQRISDRLVERMCASLRGDDAGTGGSGVGGAEEDGEGEGTRRSGLIAAADFLLYLRSFGSWGALFALGVVTLLSGVSSIAANIWLTRWIDHGATANGTRPFNHTAHPSGYTPRGPEATADDRASLVIYVGIVLITEVLSAAQIVLLTVCSLRASRILHSRLLLRLLRAPLAFFDGTTTGAVLNRVLSDMQNVDSSVPDSLVSLATQVLTLATQFGLVLYYTPWVGLALPPLLFGYYVIYRNVRLAARDSRRLSARLHSPVFSHFADALSGRETIAAYGCEERFCEANLRHVANMSRASIANEAVRKWGQSVSCQSGAVLYLVCGSACVLLHAIGQLSTAEMGLVLLYAGSLQRAVMELMMRMAQLETEFVAVERVAEYCRLEDEHDDALREWQQYGDGRPPQERGCLSLGSDADFYARQLIGGAEPMRGAIEVRGVVLRYAAHLPPALDRLTVSIPPGAKVAVCGRTGSGKSSLLGAIARFYPMDAGTIHLDGVDLASVPLGEVRTAARHIAQEVVLLDDTLLANLIAFESAERMTRATEAGECGTPMTAAESEAWVVLEALGMRQRIEALPRRLQTRVRSANLSVGERQLLCICRALVAGRGARGLRVLLADEPTAALDMATDLKVHNALLSVACTCVVVTHRMHAVHRFDRVLVLDHGRLVEEGAPAELEKVPDGHLAGLLRVAAAGDSSDAAR